MDEETKRVVDWVILHVTRLRKDGNNSQIILHIGAGGAHRHEIKTTGELIPPRKHRQEKQR